MRDSPTHWAWAVGSVFSRHLTKRPSSGDGTEPQLYAIFGTVVITKTQAPSEAPFEFGSVVF